MTAVPAGDIIVAGSLTMVADGVPALVIEGSGAAPAALVLAGTRSRLTASVVQSGERWTATIPLLASRWGSAASAPPSGRYHFTQRVLQTWHGTMLKKLALTRSGLRLRPALATLRERSRWNILLSQNGYATRIFRRSYLYRGPVWEEGYPRDDVLLTGDTNAVRTKLGIPDGVKVLLYAPTWRDDQPDRVDHLDVSAFTEKLGAGYVTLIRGHSRTLQPGTDVHAGGVVDVTSYPDVSELFLVADALITDYSSVMFDFSVTGKPILFFTPDLERYREVLRGFYFDITPVAPGPVVRDAEELVALVRGLDAGGDEYAERYAAWRARFNPRDDGHAAERVIARVLREGILQ